MSIFNRAITKRTPSVDDYDHDMNLKEPERFGMPPHTKYAELQPTRNGVVFRTDGDDGWNVDVRHFRGDGDCVHVYIDNDALNISKHEKMPESQVQAYVSRITGRR
jgi:hypothetical protein